MVMEFRARSKLAPEALEEYWQKLAVPEDYSLVATGEVRVLKPDGKLLMHYKPGAFSPEMLEGFYGTLHELRELQTANRGYASGTQAFKMFKEATRQRTAPVASAIIGSFDASPPKVYCRLTAWTGREFQEKWPGLWPLFREISRLFAETVPERFAAQMAYVNRTDPHWVIPETPFTTITVNNSYPTGYHTDKGDLDEGFSCLTVLRRGRYSGGLLVFPEYRLAVDMQDGDQLFMDAHAAHGNTQLWCGDCGKPMGPAAGPSPTAKLRQYDHTEMGCTAERISIVSYYRTKMASCGSPEEEDRRAQEFAERRAQIAEAHASGLDTDAVEEMALESADV